MTDDKTPKTSTILVLIDGLGDVDIPSLGNQTPLAYSKTPCMDTLAAHGVCGLMDPVQVGLACGSDTAHLSIFGYDPRVYYRGRGAFETMGTGLYMEVGDIGFKCNFALLDPESGIVLRRRADREFRTWGRSLCDYLNEHIRLSRFPDYQITFQYATEHRCGVRIRGPDLSDEISDTDPLKDHLPLKMSMPLSKSPEAEKTAALVNDLSKAVHEALQAHPLVMQRKQLGLAYTNIILFRGCGRRIQVPSFYEKYGLRAFAIAPTKIIAGMAWCLGMQLVDAPGATGDYNTDLLSKARTCVEWISKPEYDLGFIHIKAVDDTGHDGWIQGKCKFLEKIDEMIGFLVDQLGASFRVNLVVTGDHSTPVMRKDHSLQPVPFVLCPLPFGSIGDKVTKFSEMEAGLGCLGRFTGDQVMPIIQYFST
ncbi:hypothetical protein GAYE_FCTG49G0040 [Galdieria yellowstonensis]|uniref:Metalloenzyme domain-containing protein n=1 Tax=Galdieria yellowstonensis TaxID=3028027 RepID=A0AAV9I2F1_9RHOD|nr:hypothetical protein GAYE_FCTG49G0040 [Galdieria yellowstonensis]